MKYVVGFLFTPDQQQVVLVKKNKPTWQSGRHNGVGGKLEPGETWENCMVREFLEETGVTIPVEGWEHTVTLFNEDFECRFFRAFSGEAQNVQTMESEEIALHHMQDVLCGSIPVIDNLYWLLPLQLDMGLHFPLVARDGLPTGSLDKVREIR